MSETLAAELALDFFSASRQVSKILMAEMKWFDACSFFE
jgi:hypothetical protein